MLVYKQNEEDAITQTSNVAGKTMADINEKLKSSGFIVVKSGILEQHHQDKNFTNEKSRKAFMSSVIHFVETNSENHEKKLSKEKVIEFQTQIQYQDPPVDPGMFVKALIECKNHDEMEHSHNQQVAQSQPDQKIQSQKNDENQVNEGTEREKIQMEQLFLKDAEFMQAKQQIQFYTNGMDHLMGEIQQLKELEAQKDWVIMDLTCENARMILDQKENPSNTNLNIDTSEIENLLVTLNQLNQNVYHIREKYLNNFNDQAQLNQQQQIQANENTNQNTISDLKQDPSQVRQNTNMKNPHGPSQVESFMKGIKSTQSENPYAKNVSLTDKTQIETTVGDNKTQYCSPQENPYTHSQHTKENPHTESDISNTNPYAQSDVITVTNPYAQSKITTENSYAESKIKTQENPYAQSKIATKNSYAQSDIKTVSNPYAQSNTKAVENPYAQSNIPSKNPYGQTDIKTMENPYAQSNVNAVENPYQEAQITLNFESKGHKESKLAISVVPEQNQSDFNHELIDTQIREVSQTNQSDFNHELINTRITHESLPVSGIQNELKGSQEFRATVESYIKPSFVHGNDRGSVEPNTQHNIYTVAETELKKGFTHSTIINDFKYNSFEMTPEKSDRKLNKQNTDFINTEVHVEQVLTERGDDFLGFNKENVEIGESILMVPEHNRHYEKNNKSCDNSEKIDSIEPLLSSIEKQIQAIGEHVRSQKPNNYDEKLLKEISYNVSKINKDQSDAKSDRSEDLEKVIDLIKKENIALTNKIYSMNSGLENDLIRNQSEEIKSLKETIKTLTSTIKSLQDTTTNLAQTIEKLSNDNQKVVAVQPKIVRPKTSNEHPNFVSPNPIRKTDIKIIQENIITRDITNSGDNTLSLYSENKYSTNDPKKELNIYKDLSQRQQHTSTRDVKRFNQISTHRPSSDNPLYNKIGDLRKYTDTQAVSKRILDKGNYKVDENTSFNKYGTSNVHTYRIGADGKRYEVENHSDTYYDEQGRQCKKVRKSNR